MYGHEHQVNFNDYTVRMDKKEMSIDKFFNILNKVLEEGRFLSYENYGNQIYLKYFQSGCTELDTIIIHTANITEVEREILEELKNKINSKEYKIKQKEYIRNTKYMKNFAKKVMNGTIFNVERIGIRQVRYMGYTFSGKEEFEDEIYTEIEREVIEELITLSKSPEALAANELSLNSQKKLPKLFLKNFLPTFKSFFLTFISIIRNPFISCGIFFLGILFIPSFASLLAILLAPILGIAGYSLIKSIIEKVWVEEQQKYHLSYEEYKALEQAKKERKKYKLVRKQFTNKAKKEDIETQIKREYAYVISLMDYLDKDTKTTYLEELYKVLEKHKKSLAESTKSKSGKLALYEKNYLNIRFLGILEFIEDRVKGEIKDKKFDDELAFLTSDLEKRLSYNPTLSLFEDGPKLVLNKTEVEGQ